MCLSAVRSSPLVGRGKRCGRGESDGSRALREAALRSGRGEATRSKRRRASLQVDGAALHGLQVEQGGKDVAGILLNTWR